MKNLGYMNTWDDEPQEYLDHLSSKGCEVEILEKNRCCKEYRCKTCNIKWSVDSGD